MHLKNLGMAIVLMLASGLEAQAQAIDDSSLLQKVEEAAILENARQGRAQTLIVEIVQSARTDALERERIRLVQELWTSRSPAREAQESATFAAFQAALLADKRAVFDPLENAGIEITRDFTSSPMLMAFVPAASLPRLLNSPGVRLVHRDKVMRPT